MKLCINKQSTVERLQEAFSFTYPFLQITFYAQDVLHNGHKRRVIGNIGYLLPGIADYYFVDINKDKTVAEVEEAFAIAGLQAQVLRKSGSVWVETLLTRNWTLELQNHEGEMLSQAINAPRA